MMRTWSIVAASFSLTALTYGLGRFAYGLLLPAIQADLHMSASVAGLVAGTSFASYCVGIVLALAYVNRVEDRVLAGSAGMAATVGLAMIAVSWSGWNIALAMALCGLSTGLTSPPLAAIVGRSFSDAGQAKANGIINSGTAAGIILSGLAALMLSTSWRELYAAFAVIGGIITFWLWIAVPNRGRTRDEYPFRTSELKRPGLPALIASALLVGLASTAIWTFGANIMRADLAFSDGEVSTAWVLLGTFGFAGIKTGALTLRFGLRTVHRAAVASMALAIVCLAIADLHALLAYSAMGIFGASYIIATGSLLLWGIGLYGAHPALGLGIPFVVLAIGQTLGAPVLGAVWESAGTVPTLLLSAVVMGSATFFSINPDKNREKG
jgi:predicted MFS family arabinose efflux permease